MPELRIEHGAQVRALRRIRCVQQLSDVQVRQAENHRREVPQLLGRRSGGAALQARQDVLRMQPLSRLRFRRLGQTASREMPRVRIGLSDRKIPQSRSGGAVSQRGMQIQETHRAAGRGRGSITAISRTGLNIVTEAVAQNPPAADYGIDAPVMVKRMFTRAAWCLASGIALYIINHNEYPGTSAELLAVLGIIGLGFLGAGAFMLWSSKVAKPQLRDRLLDSLDLKGDEKALDVGCGRGLMLIGLAKRLKTGRSEER